jgi:geranylgeranyl pyrophosphate synthase
VKAVEPRSSEPDTALAELLERWFLAGDDADSVLARSVPRALWNDALFEPVRDFLARPSKGFRAQLVELGYRLGGGADAKAAIELPLIIECIHAGSLIVDDIEDDSQVRRAEPALHCTYGVPRALNAGNWLYFWPQVLLGRLALSDRARLCAHERLALCLMHCHEGQALDLRVRVDEVSQRDVPTVVRAITRLKTGGLLGMATALGAIAAEAPSERVEAVAVLGRELGVGLQMLDDLSGVLHVARRHKALEDLRHGRATWVWALLAEELDRHSYEALQREARAVALDGAPSDALLERMRFRVGTLGTRRAHRHVRQAVEQLAQLIGADDWCNEVLEQFAWLERRYAQG